MDDSTSREKILKKIRNASIDKTENPYMDIDFASPIYKEMTESLEVSFAQEFSRIGGKFIYCEDNDEFSSGLKLLLREKRVSRIFCREPLLISLLEKHQIPFDNTEENFQEAMAGLTSCEYLVARLGSIVVSSRQASGRRLVIYPEIHIVHAYTSQIVPDINDALTKLKEKYAKGLPSMISFISGPSRTADIEKTLVMGAHGPRELYLFLVDKES